MVWQGIVSYRIALVYMVYIWFTYGVHMEYVHMVYMVYIHMVYNHNWSHKPWFGKVLYRMVWYGIYNTIPMRIVLLVWCGMVYNRNWSQKPCFGKVSYRIVSYSNDMVWYVGWYGMLYNGTGWYSIGTGCYTMVIGHTNDPPVMTQ